MNISEVIARLEAIRAECGTDAPVHINEGDTSDSVNKVVLAWDGYPDGSAWPIVVIES